MAIIRGWTEHCKYLLTWFVKSRGQKKHTQKTHNN